MQILRVFLGGSQRIPAKLCYVTFSNKRKYSVDLALKSKIDFLKCIFCVLSNCVIFIFFNLLLLLSLLDILSGVSRTKFG